MQKVLKSMGLHEVILLMAVVIFITRQIIH